MVPLSTMEYFILMDYHKSFWGKKQIKNCGYLVTCLRVLLSHSPPPQDLMTSTSPSTLTWQLLPRLWPAQSQVWRCGTGCG